MEELEEICKEYVESQRVLQDKETDKVIDYMFKGCYVCEGRNKDCKYYNGNKDWTTTKEALLEAFM